MSFYVDTHPSSQSSSLIKDSALIFSGALFLVLMSKFSFHLWFTPVPVSLQTLGVLLLGALLGSKRGPAAVLTYLAIGSMGLPIFACASFGIGGGYLLGFVLSAYLVGRLVEKKVNLILASTLGVSLILCTGFLWLSCFIGYKPAFILGVSPFLIGEGIKVCIASLMIPLIRKP